MASINTGDVNAALSSTLAALQASKQAVKDAAKTVYAPTQEPPVSGKGVPGAPVKAGP